MVYHTSIPHICHRLNKLLCKRAMSREYMRRLASAHSSSILSSPCPANTTILHLVYRSTHLTRTRLLDLPSILSQMANQSPCSLNPSRSVALTSRTVSLCAHPLPISLPGTEESIIAFSFMPVLSPRWLHTCVAYGTS